MRPDVNSPYYPYMKPQANFYSLRGSTDLPKIITNYLMDAPDGVYTPKDDNALPRCRLWKYLYYDDPNPLENALPTAAEKRSVLFNPHDPEKPPTDKGYRLIPQLYVKEAQERAQNRLMFYLGRTLPGTDDLSVNLSVVFVYWEHYTHEINTQSDDYSRAFAVEQALIEAFHGVNFDGVGTFFFSKRKHPDCGSRAIFDGNTNVGREITMAIEIPTAIDNGIQPTFGASFV